MVPFVKISLQEPHYFGNRNIILRHMRITNVTFLELIQFIEPKTAFTMFLNEVMKEK